MYPPNITVEDGRHLKVYTFGGVPRDKWNAIRDAVRKMSGVERVDGAFESGVAMWVSFVAGADQEAVDAAILRLICAELPADVPLQRIPFQGFPE